MVTKMTFRGILPGVLLLWLSGPIGVAAASTVTYEFVGCNISTGDCTASVLGNLTFNAPPANATSGWNIIAGQEDEILDFTWYGLGSIDLTSTAITGTIISNSGAELDAGAFNTATVAPKWTFAFATGPGTDIVIYTPLPDCGSCVYEGDWVLSAVPVPATAWLFGSGLLGLIGVARRTKSS